MASGRFQFQFQLRLGKNLQGVRRDTSYAYDRHTPDKCLRHTSYTWPDPCVIRHTAGQILASYSLYDVSRSYTALYTASYTPKISICIRSQPEIRLWSSASSSSWGHPARSPRGPLFLRHFHQFSLNKVTS